MENDDLDLEGWVKLCYPKTYERWDIEASHLIDLDEYLIQENPDVIKDWRKHQKAEKRAKENRDGDWRSEEGIQDQI